MVSNFMRRGLGRIAKRALRNQSGSMASVLALSAVPLMLAGGAAVDYGNWVAVEARLQAAVDAAALATAREINLEHFEAKPVHILRLGNSWHTLRV